MKQIIVFLIFLLFIFNTTVAQYDDPKWQFGAEAGFAWIGFSGQGLKMDVINTSTQSTKRSNWRGIRVMGSIKYNLVERVQLLGGLAFVKAKGEIRRFKRNEALFSGRITSFDEKIMQDITLIEFPTYVRFYLLNEPRSIKNQLNIFIDFGASFKIPIKSDLTFTKSEIPSAEYEGVLEFQSYVERYVALGISINNELIIAFNSSRMKSQAKDYEFIKYWSRLKSISFTVFF